MERARYLVATVAVIALLVLAAAFIVPGILAQREADIRSESDRTVAIRAVATAEPTRPADRFNAPHWTPNGEIAVVQVLDSADPSYVVDVVVRWDAASGSSSVVSMTRIPPAK